jgi:hypothetical protein
VRSRILEKTSGQAELFTVTLLYRSGLVRSRILLRNLSRENEGLAVECSASNSDRTTGRTGLKTGQDRIRSQEGHQEQDRTEGKPGSQVGQDPSQYRTKARRV